MVVHRAARREIFDSLGALNRQAAMEAMSVFGRQPRAARSLRGRQSGGAWAPSGSPAEIRICS